MLVKASVRRANSCSYHYQEFRGIGIVAADLASHAADRWYPVLRRAAASSVSHGFGWNHTLCHGDLGAWEVLDHALAAGCAPRGVDRRTLDARIITSLEEHGPVTGLARKAFTPGLMPGVSGIAYQLLRMNPDSDLPSVLLPDPGTPVPL